MKEFSIEEKAKRYESSLERCRKLYNEAKANEYTSDIEDYETIFPELAAESEGERIRKDLIAIFKGQIPFTSEKDAKRYIAWLEKQGEQKVSISKVEPKFKVGDWITDGQLTCKVLSATSKSYELHLYNDDYCHFETHVRSIDKQYHLWTIQDAKDGDVLAEDSCIFIIKELNQDLSAKVYCCLHDDGDFEINSTLGFYVTSTHPATKEQRDTLMKAMSDAGWVFDFEKKELKKIASKFKSGDWVLVSTAKGDRVVQIDSVEYFKDGHPCYFTTEGRWFGNGTKARLLTDKDMETITIPESKVIVKQKPTDLEDFINELSKQFPDVSFAKLSRIAVRVAKWAKPADSHCSDCTNAQGCVNCTDGDMKETEKPCWSEEDEEMCQETIDWFEKKCFPYALESENPARESIKWLKSLKERIGWKPSGEQMEALWNVYQGGKEQAELATLYNDLKKLREE